jgi:hypothetical protein
LRVREMEGEEGEIEGMVSEVGEFAVIVED